MIEIAKQVVLFLGLSAAVIAAGFGAATWRSDVAAIEQAIGRIR